MANPRARCFENFERALEYFYLESFVRSNIPDDIAGLNLFRHSVETALG